MRIFGGIVPGIWKSAVCVLVVFLMVGFGVHPGIVRGKQETSSAKFRNAAGNPIMAVDMDRRKEIRTEGDRMDPQRGNPGSSMTNPQNRWHRNKPFKHGTHWHGSLLVPLLLGLVGLFLILLRILLGVIVFVDLRNDTRDMSGLWIPVVLISGILGAIAYGLFRLSME